MKIESEIFDDIWHRPKKQSHSDCTNHSLVTSEPEITIEEEMTPPEDPVERFMRLSSVVLGGLEHIKNYDIKKRAENPNYQSRFLHDSAMRAIAGKYITEEEAIRAGYLTASPDLPLSPTINGINSRLTLAGVK